jgi:hypothetical protein
MTGMAADLRFGLRGLVAERLRGGEAWGMGLRLKGEEGLGGRR